MRDIKQSRDFLLLAKAYQEHSWDPRWALQIATDEKLTASAYREEACQVLKEMQLST